MAEIRERVDAHARATGSDGKVICALSGGVDSAVAAALVHRAVGRPADLHLRRPRADAQEGVGAAARRPSRPTWHAPGDGRRARAVPRRAWPASRTRRRSGGSSATSSSASSRRRPPRLGRDRLPDPGHALPGRDRVDDARDEGRAEDQDPPQRRRPAGRPALPADRAAALPVQGRGPRRSGSSSGCPRRWSSASRSRAPAWRSGSSARSPPSGWTRCARPTGS